MTDKQPALTFKRATRAAVKLKIGIDGPAGSGKTEGALALARGITGNGRVAVADSENESASYYADEYTFDTIPNFTEPTCAMIAEAIHAAVAAKYDALVIDSLSHAWLDLLAKKDAYDADHPKANRWTTWGRPEFGPRWEKLMGLILHAPIHIIATMRSKQAYEQIESNGKKEIVKLGLQPQVREGADYEFGLVFSLEHHNHRAIATKDRTRLFTPDDRLDLRDPSLHQRLAKWMNGDTLASDADLAAIARLLEHPAIAETQAVVVVAQQLATGRPPAAKVARWIEQLTARITAAETAATTTAPATAGVA